MSTDRYAAIRDVEDLGLDYPPADRTEDLRAGKGNAASGSDQEPADGSNHTPTQGEIL